jgi:hypothetical protein
MIAPLWPGPGAVHGIPRLCQRRLVRIQTTRGERGIDERKRAVGVICICSLWSPIETLCGSRFGFRHPQPLLNRPFTAASVFLADPMDAGL